MKTIDSEEIRKWHSLFRGDGGLFEIRLLGDKVLSGYFTDVETAIKSITPLDKMQIYQVYFTVNNIHPGCSSREQFNRFLPVKGTATSKNDIMRRVFLPIDIDVQRPSGISSTEEEKEYAHRKAADVYRFLSECGFPEPVVCDSSSGYHLYYPIDLPNTGESETLVKRLFGVLSARFTDERVKVDAQVGDANRIMRLPGTWGRKGHDTAERPHRMARIVKSPASLNRVGMAFLSAFADRYQVKEGRPVHSSGEPFDLRAFISRHGLRVRNEASWGSGTKFVLEECPFDSAHHAPDSALFLSAQGTVGFKCFHDSCAHHDWHELRHMLEPDAYPRLFTPQQARRHVVREETEEIGKKWLSLTDVEDLSLDSLPRIHTGFEKIDKSLGGGLFFSETTIVSGINGSGKSSWLNTLILNAVEDGHKAALWTGELQPSRLKRWLVQAAAGDGRVQESTLSPGKYCVPQAVSERICRWLDGKFLLYNNGYSSSHARLLAAMEEPASKGFKLFILDNLFAMDLDGLGTDENARQKALILSLVEFAKRHEVHVVLVAHPRKVVSFLRKEDILGSSALQNAVDNIFIIHRYGEDFKKRVGEYFDPSYSARFDGFGNVLEICKNREFGAVEVMVGMHYSMKSRRFSDSLTEKPYGWDAPPVQAIIEYRNETMPFEPFNPSTDTIPF